MFSKRVSNLHPDTEEDGYNSSIFVIETVLNQLNTVDLVKVVAVNGDGTLNVQPIVANVTAGNERIQQPIIYNVRYLRWQVGTNAILMTPQINDVGLFCVCKKDISSAESGIVASNRKWNLSDGVYLGGIFNLNVQPTSTIEINTDITITGTNVNIIAENANVNATTINLGEGAVQGVAKLGGKVTTDGTPSGSVVGFIAEGSTVVKAL